MRTEIAPGVFRLEVPVPFRLGLVNLYLIDTGEGFILIDTGVATAATSGSTLAPVRIHWAAISAPWKP